LTLTLAFVAFVAFVAFSSSVALAASTPREVHSGLVMGEGPDVVVFEIKNATVTAVAPDCLTILGGASAACDTPSVNQYSVPKAFKVNNLRIVVSKAGNAASTCDANIEVDGAPVGTEASAFSVVTLSAVINTAQNFVVNEGALLAIALNDDSGCVDTTAPILSVQLEGQFLN
jgi:hypothetical protein